jgi:SHS2 domain-containing protein
MTRAGYRLLSHTADVALAAWGQSLGDAFAEAVRGLVAVTFDPRTIRKVEERTVTLTGESPTRLLVALLQEVVYLFDAEGFVPCRATIKIEDTSLDAHLSGEQFDPTRHERIGPGVKAITYHEAKVDPGPPARLRVILDI